MSPREDNRLVRPLDAVFDAVDDGWRPVTEAFRTSPRGRALIAFVDHRVAEGAAVVPAEPLRALRLTPPEAVRVVILGQDPYHGIGQAEGLSFSVPPGEPPPPSLRNLFKELRRDLGGPVPASGSLLAWAERGVLLLNTVLTVELGRPASHAGRGWEALTDAVLDAVARAERPVAFLLWGAAAQARRAAVEAASGDSRRHAVFTANHPSPLSATRPPVPFVGCGHFGATAAFLAARGRPIDWALPAAAPAGGSGLAL